MYNLDRTQTSDSFIKVSQDQEIRYWTNKFRISREELLEAVKEVGGQVKEVQKYLKTKKGS